MRSIIVQEAEVQTMAAKQILMLVGGSWHEVATTFDNAHRLGTLVKAPAGPAHPEWMRQFLAVLGSRIEP
jgi:protease I